MTDRIRISLESIIELLIPEMTVALAVFAKWEYTVSGVYLVRPCSFQAFPSARVVLSVNSQRSLFGRARAGHTPSRNLAPSSSSNFTTARHRSPRSAVLDPASTPVLTTLAGGTAPVARVGDTVTITPAQISAGDSSREVTLSRAAPSSVQLRAVAPRW